MGKKDTFLVSYDVKTAVNTVLLYMLTNKVPIFHTSYWHIWAIYDAILKKHLPTKYVYKKRSNGAGL